MLSICLQHLRRTMKPTITRIRSGGQSGVDRAALDFARCQNIEICGWCPKGGWAEDYPEAPGIKAMYLDLGARHKCQAAEILTAAGFLSKES